MKTSVEKSKSAKEQHKIAGLKKEVKANERKLSAWNIVKSNDKDTEDEKETVRSKPEPDVEEENDDEDEKESEERFSDQEESGSVMSSQCHSGENIEIVEEEDDKKPKMPAWRERLLSYAIDPSIVRVQ